MHIRQNVPLREYSTMRLGGVAAYLADITDRHEVTEATTWATSHNLPFIMIGIGSNIVWTDKGFPGLVMVNKVMGFEQQHEDAENTYISVKAGENWDSVVKRTVDQGLTGIEALSLIPGTVGATPIQNVGAYGQEIADTLVSVEAYDTRQTQFVTIPKADCAFGYRTSRFKTSDKGRFIITGLTLHLRHSNPTPPFYSSVQSYFMEHNIIQYTPQILRQAVISIRTRKLPDPAKVANNGSFFANPVVNNEMFLQLQADYPDIIHWGTTDGQVKLSAAWLIEQAGFKDSHDPETGMATWPKQALILVNEHAKSTADLLRFKQKIVDKVQAMFGITLQQEPELIGES